MVCFSVALSEIWLAISMATFHRFNFYGGATIAHVALNLNAELSRDEPFRVTRLKIIFTIHIYIHYQNPKKKIKKKKKSTIGDHTPKTICFLFKYSSSLIIPVSCEAVIFPAIRAESPKTIVSPKVPGPRIPLAYRMEEGKREVRKSDVESRMTPMMTDRKT